MFSYLGSSPFLVFGSENFLKKMSLLSLDRLSRHEGHSQSPPYPGHESTPLFLSGSPSWSLPGLLCNLGISTVEVKKEFEVVVGGWYAIGQFATSHTMESNGGCPCQFTHLILL